MVVIIALLVFVCVRGGICKVRHSISVFRKYKILEMKWYPLSTIWISLPQSFLLVATVGEYGDNLRNDLKTNQKSKHSFLHLNLYGLVGINIFMVPCLSIKHAGT